MTRAFIEFGTYATILIVKDSNVIYYSEYNYNTTLLETFYRKLHPINLDELVVIMHGMMYKKQCDKSYVAFKTLINAEQYYSNMDCSDVDKVMKLADLIGAKSLRIVDKFGYYKSFQKQPAILVDRFGNICCLFYQTDKECFVQYVNVADLQDVLGAAIARFSMTNIVNVTTDFIQDNVSMISNYSNIEQDKMLHVFVAVSTAMYACSDKSNKYCLSIVDTGTDPAKSAVTSDEAEEPKERQEDDVADLIKEEPEDSIDDVLSDDVLFSDAELDDDAYDNAIKSELQQEDIKEPVQHVTIEKSKPKGKGGLKVMVAVAFAILSVLGNLYSAIQKKEIVQLDKQAAEISVSTDDIERYAQEGTVTTITAKDTDVYSYFSSLALHGYVGAVISTKKQYCVYIYLYDENDLENTMAQITEKYPTAIANRKRSFKVANGVLTTYEVTFQREAA